MEGQGQGEEEDGEEDGEEDEGQDEEGKDGGVEGTCLYNAEESTILKSKNLSILGPPY